MLERRIWRLDTSSDWWDCLGLEWWDDQQWLSNFCLRNVTFMELCTWLIPALRQVTHWWPTILSGEESCYCCVEAHHPRQLLLSGTPVRAWAILMEVVRAINSVPLCRIICLGDVDTIVAGFAALGFLNCGGVVDGTHIPIHAPPNRAAQFINRKVYFSMVQALVDHWGQFIDICVGWSGHAYDARIFKNSCLYCRVQVGTFFPQQDFVLGDLQMPTCIVGNVAYPRKPWLMKPYTGHLDPTKEQFNVHLNQTRASKGTVQVPDDLPQHGGAQHP
ncbi:uncharacterized protein LOC142831228 [Pelodiscus sinensis]|uniref:uncharacterized protein LOC142831228 n=1 Tax=Pelodiscus sinensis TaxID=13735 RepID=UPI003F6AD1F8